MKAAQIMPANWDAVVRAPVQTRAYCSGLSEFLGEGTPGCPEQSWQIGVEAGQQAYCANCVNKEDKWLQHYRARMTRGIRA